MLNNLPCLEATETQLLHDLAVYLIINVGLFHFISFRCRISPTLDLFPVSGHFYIFISSRFSKRRPISTEILISYKVHEEEKNVLILFLQALIVSLNFFPADAVKNGSMEWESIAYGKSDTVGSRYSYNSNHHALTMKQEGTYFLYTQLQLSCTGICGNGSLSITFEGEQTRELLSCSVQMKSHKTSVNKCWTVVPHIPAKSRLMARMHTSFPPGTSLSLDPDHSGFGVFLVDGPGIE